MFGGHGTGGFVRTRIPPVERALSWLVLGLVGITGGAVYLSGQTYDESLFGLDPASLASVTPARLPVNTIVVVPAGPTRVGARPRQTDGAAGVLASVSLPGWRTLGDVEGFSPTNLYEKINGRAEQYISYDFVGLTYRGLATDDGTRFIDVYVYDMGTPEGAFGIYSVERDPDAEGLPLGRRGYRSGSSFFLWHGTYYMQVLASDADDALTAQTRRVVEDLLQSLPDAGSTVPGLALLSAAGLVADSEKYYANNALGFGFLTHTWSADYQVDDVRVTVFVSTQADDAGADAVVAGYRSYLDDFGAKITVSPGPGGTGESLFGDMDGYYDVILRQGSRVAGAALLEDRALAEHVAARLLPAMVTDGRDGDG
jgi:hypothetical protein